MNEEERKNVLLFIHTACQQGCRKKIVCQYLGIDIRRIQRWKKDGVIDKRKGSPRKVEKRLTEAEKDEIIETCTNERFRNLNPHEIVAILAEEGKYIASESSFYRTLHERNLMKHRRDEKKPTGSQQIEVVITEPHKQLSWDISYLKTTVKGKYFYLYMFIDIWNRKIIQWAIHEEESDKKAKELLEDIGIKNYSLHSDNGGPMKSHLMKATLEKLGVLATFSRPYVSNDNAYSEALFKTVKLTAGYPKAFDSIEEAREWMSKFVQWYNYEHKHSGIGYVTPQERLEGKDKIIFAKRNETYLSAYNTHPERWSKPPKQWKHEEKVSLKRGERKRHLS